DEGDYGEAIDQLEDLVKVMGSLEKARLKVFEAELTGADSAHKVKDVVGKLEPNEITALGSDKQVELLLTLRTAWCSKCNKRWAGMACSDRSCTGGSRVKPEIDKKKTPELYKARCKIYDNMQMQPEFVKKDKEFRANVVKAFENDPKFEEAKKNWATLDETERFKFLDYAAKKQCTVMGQPDPDVLPDHSLEPRKCNNSIYTCTGAKFVCKRRSCSNKGGTWIGSNDDTVNKWDNYKCPTCKKQGHVKSGTTCQGNEWGFSPGG